MAERSPQTLANHVRLDPPFHYFPLPVFAISWIVSVVLLALATRLLASLKGFGRPWN